MKIVTPISNLIKNIKNYNNILNVSDYFELRHYNFDFINKDKILFLHSDIQVNHILTDKDLLELTAIIKKYNKIRYISFHLASNYKNPKINLHKIFEIGSNKTTREKMIKNAYINFETLKKKFPNMVFSVENNNFFNTGAYEHVTSPDFISEIVSNSNIDFLFDVSHALITSYNTNVSFEDYFLKLPLKKISQIHLSRSVKKNNLFLDLHYLPIINNELINLINEIKPKFATIEYYKNIQNLCKLSKQLKKIYETK